MNELQELEKLNVQLAAQLKKHRQQQTARKSKMSALKRAGLIRAGEYWRDGKYFYLIHQTDARGNRKREYIGTDTKQIEKARAAIRRAAEYDRLDVEDKRQQRELSEAFVRLRGVLCYL